MTMNSLHHLSFVWYTSLKPPLHYTHMHVHTQLYYFSITTPTSYKTVVLAVWT